MGTVVPIRRRFSVQGEGSRHKRIAETAYLASREAARESLRVHRSYKGAAAAFQGLRFHDLRHQAIAELAERGASDATVMALAGHMSRANDGALFPRPNGSEAGSRGRTSNGSDPTPSG